MRILIFRNDDDLSDDIGGNNGLLMAASAPTDDRHARHITHDDRLVSSLNLRRRLDHLSKNSTINKFLFIFLNSFSKKR